MEPRRGRRPARAQKTTNPTARGRPRGSSIGREDPSRHPAGCRSSPGELPPQGPREGRTPPTLYSKAHALGDLGADIRPQTTLACAIPTVDGNLHLSRKVDGSLSSSLRTATRVPSRRLHRRSTRPGKGETLRDKVIEAVLMNRSRLQPACCHAPHTPIPLNLTSGLITRRSGFVLSLCQKSYIHARRPSLSSSLVGKGSIDYVRRAIHLNHGDERAAAELLFEWCHSRKEVLETFVSDDEIKKRVKRAVRKVRRELAG